MSETWRECPEYGDALIDVDDDEGEQPGPLTLRIPYEHRHTSIGWGRRPRVRWKGPDGHERTGLEESRGLDGLLVRDEWGEQHALPHESYQLDQEYKPQPTPLERLLSVVKLTKLAKAVKSYPPPPPGSRWITLRPNGPGTEGHPVLIQPQPDGTHRIIGGAGGKLNYLRLDDVKSRDELKARRKQQQADKRQKEKDRKALLTPEEKEAEAAHQKAQKERIRDAQRKVIEKVRQSVGGVSEDLNEEELGGLPDKVRQRLLDRHHRRQWKEAMRRRRDIAEHLAHDEIENLLDRDAVERSMQDVPDLLHEAQEDAQRTLDLLEQEAEERKTKRKRPTRVTSAKGEEVRDRADETTGTEIRNLDRDELVAELQKKGGASDNRGAILGGTASEELERRALQARAEAKALIDHVDGHGDPEGHDLKAIGEAIKRAGLSPDASPEEIKAALESEAAMLYRRAQVHEVTAQQYRETEKEHGPERTMRRLAARDAMEALHGATADAARKLGLRERDGVPLREAEVAELGELLRDFSRIDKMAADFRSGVDVDAEGPAYDTAREAFNLPIEEPPDDVVEQHEERVLRELGQRLQGLAMEGRPSYDRAVADGHYGRMADVLLGLTKQAQIDRPTMDALGLRNTAVLARFAMEQGGVDRKAALDALLLFHVKDQKQRTLDALAAADAFIPNVENHVDGTPGGMLDAMRQLDASEAELDQVERIVGGAIGSMEATATVAQALRGKAPEHMTLSFKGQSAESHFRWLAAVGLTTEDYEVDAHAKEIRIPQESWSKLLRPDGEEVVAARKKAIEIKRGDHDEDGWMPAGLVSRPSQVHVDPVRATQRPVPPLDLNHADLPGSLRDHIGARLLGGERPADISTDLLSAKAIALAKDPEAYTKAVRELFPVHGEEDKAQIAKNREHFQARRKTFEAYNEATKGGNAEAAEAALQQLAAIPKHVHVQEKRDSDWHAHFDQVARDYAEKTGQGDPIHSRSLYAGADPQQVNEAVWQTLAAKPYLKAAFVPMGELDHAHRQALQDRFYDKIGGRDWSGEFQAELGKAAAAADKEGMGAAKNAGPFQIAGSAEKVTHENIHKHDPRRAKDVAFLYPREGRELFAQAHGTRPDDDLKMREQLHPDVAEALHQAIGEHGKYDPKELIEHAHEQAALKKLGITRGQMFEEIPGAREGMKKEEIDAGWHFTPEARKHQRDMAVAVRDYRTQPHQVTKAFGGMLHDAEREHFESVLGRSGTPWAEAIDFMGGVEPLYHSLREELRGEFAQHFGPTYHKLTGRQLSPVLDDIPHSELYAKSCASPKMRQELQKQRLKDIQASRKRGGKGEKDELGRATGGRFEKGGGLESLRQELEASTAVAQRQGDMVGIGLAPKAKPPEPAGLGFGNLLAPKAKPPEAATLQAPEARQAAKTIKVGDKNKGEEEKHFAAERHHLGKRVEEEIGALMGGNVGAAFDPRAGKVDLRAGNAMSGRRVTGQRVIKQMLANGKGRLGAFLGTGAGKTAIAIGAYGEHQAKGHASHGLFLVPSAVQEQFREEMAQFTEPGKFRFDTGTGKDHDERLALLRDKSVHMRVLTHQSATRTFLQIAADHHGMAPEAALEKMRGMKLSERADFMRQAMDGHGIPRHLTVLDEAHLLTTRGDAPESDQAIVLGAMSHPTNSSQLLAGTATPHKNDTTEVGSMMRLLDPERYDDQYQFRQAWGPGMAAVPEAIRRETDHLTYTDRIDPPVKRTDMRNPELQPDGTKAEGQAIAPHPEVAQRVQAIRDAHDKLRRAISAGEEIDPADARALAPEKFEGKSDEEVRASIGDNPLGLASLRDHGVRKALQLAPIEKNEKLRRMVETVEADLKAGKRGLIFSDSAEEARHVMQTLHQRGLAAGLYDGSLSQQERQKWRKAWNKGEHKIGVLTSAGEAGLNLFQANVLHHYDRPKTPKSEQQRNGRIFRSGQEKEVELHSWEWDDESDKAAARRLRTKDRVASVFETVLPHMDDVGIAKEYYDQLQQKHQELNPAPHALAAK
jgi:superfamily II DNA or RNA helicase